MVLPQLGETDVLVFATIETIFSAKFMVSMIDPLCSQSYALFSDCELYYSEAIQYYFDFIKLEVV
jgi:hypothetical protein